MSVLADWLVRQAPSALHRGDLRPEQRRALHAIRRCRTPASGGQRYRCAHCGGEHHGYHSCHHRACPRCGGGKTATWTQQQVARLLPVPYFFVTCTVPESLHGAFAARPELLHDLFFKAAAGAIQTVAAMPRHLGAELGLLGVLHTSGRQLQHHPHIHFIVPGGGLRAAAPQLHAQIPESAWF
ncbi:MAG TPA: transposase zinc-binding domain-containing protein, partial [Opitutaceae bacterium]|nr:transposase zinc-binding domain-containing protein [Opitutaceae bacterium]HPO00594.1 transposase zinc-binding domain-containing protein [Opitutaceae bacterium]